MRTATLLCLVALLASCDRPKEPDPRELAARALRDMLTYPLSTVVNVSAGTDAAEVTLRTAAPVAQVAEWYRTTLALNGWDLKNEGKTGAGVVSIYAVKQGRPLWITLRPGADAPGTTTYTLVGALPDTAALGPSVP